jgi:hypothetical protein
LASPAEPDHFWRATALYTALTIVIAYPLSLHPASLVLSDSADTDLVVWLLSWDVHAFLHRPWTIFDANTFAPLHHTLAFSENLIGSALVAAPIVWITGNVVLSMNLVALFSCVACGSGCYLLARRSGVAEEGALFAGLVFAFAPPRFLRLDQLFLATIAWVPFALAYLQTYFDRGRPRDLRIAAAFFTLQVFTSGHGAVFLLVAAAMLFADRLFRSDPAALLRRLPKDIGVVGVLALLPVVFLIVPYRSVQAELGLRRSLSDWRVLHARSYLAAPTYVQSWLLARLAPEARINDTADAYLFPGWTTLLLAGAAVVSGIKFRSAGPANGPRRTAAIALNVVAIAALALGLLLAAGGPQRLKLGSAVLFSAREAWRVWLIAAVCVAIRAAMLRRVPIAPGAALRAASRQIAAWLNVKRRDKTSIYLLILLLSLWLASGPPFGLWPYVYWLPGFNFIRASSRFTLMGMVGLAVLAGAGFDALTARAGRHVRTAAAILAGVLIVAECLVPLEGVPYHVDVPAADRWLATRTTPFVVAEVPLPELRNVALFNKRQSTYMLHSTAHWQKTVHGWAGLLPVSHFDLYDALTRFPDDESVVMLNAFNVDYLVVHCDVFVPGAWPSIDERIRSLGDALTLVYTDATSRVYALQHRRK